MAERGKYIVIEGVDGTGKSTQAEMLVNSLKVGGVNTYEVAEPGATAIGQHIRTLIKNGDIDRDPMTNLLLFTADRLETWNNIIKPTLATGSWVVAARNWYSSYAYQGYGEGVDINLIEDTTRQIVGNDYLIPDYSIILNNNNLAELQERINLRADADAIKDNFEQKDLHFKQRISLGYSAVGAVLADAVIKTDGKSIDEVHELVLWHLNNLNRQNEK